MVIHKDDKMLSCLGACGKKTRKGALDSRQSQQFEFQSSMNKAKSKGHQSDPTCARRENKYKSSYCISKARGALPRLFANENDTS